MMIDGLQRLFHFAARVSLATGGGPDIQYGRIFAAFVLCAVLAVGVAVAIRKRGGFGLASRFSTTRRLKVLEISRLNLKSSIYLIAVDGSEFILSSDPAGVKLVCQLGASPHVPQAAPDPLSSANDPE